MKKKSEKLKEVRKPSIPPVANIESNAQININLEAIVREVNMENLEKMII